jgi:pilus assembly protein CpaC
MMAALAWLMLSGDRVLSADRISLQTEATEKINLVLGKSVVLRSSKPVTRISEPTPEIASAIALSPFEIYLTGKGAGTTSLILWQDSGAPTIYDVEVVYDVSTLKQKLHEVLPHERDLRVIATHDSITLAGRISSTTNLSQALAMADAFAPEGKVKNLLEVGGVHQVMLVVRIAEMSRTLIRKLGINFSWQSGQEFAVSMLGGLTRLAPPGQGELAGLFVSPAVNAVFRFQSGSATWTGLVDALKGEGLIKILAEPTLISQSGQSADFLAGGEYPIPVPQGLGTVAIEYRSFGVGLTFTPIVLSENRINIEVAPVVSELDFSAAIQIEGFSIPALRTRRASTMVELADGQSFAIAGLLQDSARDTLSKYPGLGDIPILGALFRSRDFQKSETELIIIVTPHLVKPLDLRQQPLPTDYYVEPDDTELYLFGLMQGRARGDGVRIKGELDGDFGHALPQPH